VHRLGESSHYGKILIGGGGYKDLKKTGKGKVTNSAVLGKRASRNDSSNSDDEESTRLSKKNTADVEVIDLTMSSSPVPEPIDVETPSASPNARSSSPLSYVSDDEIRCVSLRILCTYMN